MSKLKEALHKKRETTENHIRQLQKDGKQDVRYTSMMPDIPFLLLGLLSDAGWITQLIAGILYFCRNGLRHASDYASLVALAAVVIGVAYIVYLNKIHEKEIATRLQKNLGFGLTVYAGLAGAAAGVLQIVTYAGASPEIVWASAGGSINFIFGLPIYLSFKKGIVYGVQ